MAFISYQNEGDRRPGNNLTEIDKGIHKEQEHRTSIDRVEALCDWQQDGKRSYIGYLVQTKTPKFQSTDPLAGRVA